MERFCAFFVMVLSLATANPSMGMTIFFFFFQAEDGIRDDLVTGVQTCALPIFRQHANILQSQIDQNLRPDTAFMLYHSQTRGFPIELSPFVKMNLRQRAWLLRRDRKSVV